MKKVMSVYAQNLAYYNEGEIIGGWLDLPTTKEEIDDYLNEIVRIDNEHEEYEIADIDDCPFEYEIIQWADLHKLNNLAIIYSSLDEKELEMVNAYCENIESNLGIDEIINICLQTDKIPYYEYDSQFNGYGSNEEKMGLTIANETGLLDTLQKLGVQDYFDFERYGEEFGFYYQLLDNGYLEYTDLDKKLYSKEEIEEIANKLLLKEKDYDFLLIAKYGDRVYNPNEVFMKRIRNGLIVAAALIFLFLSQMSYLTVIAAIVVGYLVYKQQYTSLRSWYKKHLNYIDSLLPYYLKSLEVLVHHYTVPVALAKSIDDAPEVFKPGLKRLVEKIEAGDSSIDPYMDFAKEYPVRDSMRMMRLLYRLGLGEQEKKHQQLVSFSKSVSSLQAKSREMKYQARLNTMERKTMIMMCVTGFGSLGLLLISIFMIMSL